MASPEGVAVQAVKLKVLYTLDAEAKDNHLARWPHSIEVNTCFIDNANQIGVVDLKTCLEAVTTASPEIVADIETDYAVYAYDYSEEDIPLVGQGMLSHARIRESLEEGDNQAMVTGRITKGFMGLLSKNAQPTLEVRLKLKPVTAPFHVRHRSGSVSSQSGRPPWVQDSDAGPPPRSASPMDTSGLEDMQRILREGVPRERTTSSAPGAYSTSRPGSRAGTPGPQQTQQTNLYPRPDSRAGSRQPQHVRRDSFNSGYYSGEEAADEGPARKRAKVSKVSAPAKSSFNIEQHPNSLRVAASTASSVRLHRPVPINPSAAALPSNTSLNEEPIRPPTPIPAMQVKPRGPRRLPQSKLTTIPPATAPAPHPNPPQPQIVPDSAVSSPEEVGRRSVSSTPVNMPSSPPVMFDHSGPYVTSPALPPMHANEPDSGFMDGQFDEYFDDTNLLNLDVFDVHKPQSQGFDSGLDLGNQVTGDAKYPPVFEEGNDVEGLAQNTIEQPQLQLGRSFVPPPAQARPMSRAQSFTPINRSGPSMSSPKLAPAPFPRARQIEEEQRAKLPAVSASDPAGRGLQRSNTWAPDSDALMSEAPAGDADSTKARVKKRVGKEQTRARLENAIASGVVPPYCDNCGSIDTPAWRRAWVKDFECDWDDVETSLRQGEIVWKEPLTHDDEGNVLTFRGMKTDRKPGDESEGWRAVSLCNPCGLWFNKQKYPRPRAKWDKKQKGKKRRERSKKTSVAAAAKSDAQTPFSDESSPAETSADPPDAEENDTDEGVLTVEEKTIESHEPQLPPMIHYTRSTSAEPNPRVPNRFVQRPPLERKAQSSPMRRPGSEAEPIDLGLTPKPLRRQLFPSPNKPQVRSDPMPIVAKATINMPLFVRRSPRLTKTKDVFQVPGIAGAVALTADGKENIVPELVMNESFESLFEAQAAEGAGPPASPTPKRRSTRLLSRTPQRSFGAEISPNARTPTFKTPNRKEQHPVAAALLGTARKDLEEMTPFSRSIHEALNSNFGPVNFASSGSKKRTPNKDSNFDFPDLPSLNNSSPSHGQMFSYDFSELPTDRLYTDFDNAFSTDAPMPSSPPNFDTFFNFSNVDGDTEEGHHENVDRQALGGGKEESCYPDPDAMTLAPAPVQATRRSPRKGKGK